MSGSLQPVTLASLLPIARASNAWRFNASGALEQVGADLARLDHDPVTLARRGLLIEPQRTNSIPNPRCEGGTVGVLGSGGALPTGWQLRQRLGSTTTAGDVVVTGLTVEVHAIGTEDGIGYAEIGITGTPSESCRLEFLPAGATAVPVASDGTLYAGSFFLRAISGTQPGGSAIRIQRYTTSGTSAVPGAEVAVSPTTAALRGQRWSVAHGATTGARAMVLYSVNLTASVEVNWRFRLGGAQFETGADASSLILPPASSPGASTRLADALVRTLGVAELSAQGFTLVAEGLVAAQAEVARHLLALDDNTANNAVAIRIPASSSTVELVVVNDGVETVTELGSLTPGSPFRVAARCAPGAFQASLNGAAAAGNAAAMPAVTRLRPGRLGPSGTFLRGHLRLAALSRGLRAASVLPALSVPGATYL